MTEERQDGPSTLTYLETRLNLLTVAIEKMETTIDRRFVAQESAAKLVAMNMEDRFRHMEEVARLNKENTQIAVNKAEAAQHAHNVGQNEWRGTLNDFKSTLVTRAEFDKSYSEFQAYRLEQSQRRGDSVAQMTVIVSAVSAVVTIIVNVAIAFFRTGHG